MGGSRSLKRTSPLTLLLGLVLLLAFFYYMMQPSVDSSSPKDVFSPKTDSERVKSAVQAPAKAPKVQHYKMNNLTASSEALKNKEKVLILTPLAKFYEQYWQNLLKLEYPRELVELGFITPTTREGNAVTKQLTAAVNKIQNGSKKHRFAKVTIMRQDFTSPGGQSEKERHSKEHQKERRSAMSQARNSLVFTTLNPSISWVLWLDGDIVETPKSLIQDLTSHNKDIIVPNCFQRYKENGAAKIRPYDFNSWHDSDSALKMAKKMGEDEIILEGYADMATYRLLMAFEYDDKKETTELVKLDGVGGTALLAKAAVHRDGAMFPPFAFYNLIETEGFAKMARRLKYQPYGLPNYLVQFLAISCCYYYCCLPLLTRPRSIITTSKRTFSHYALFIIHYSFTFNFEIRPSPAFIKRNYQRH